MINPLHHLDTSSLARLYPLDVLPRHRIPSTHILLHAVAETLLFGG